MSRSVCNVESYNNISKAHGKFLAFQALTCTGSRNTVMTRRKWFENKDPYHLITNAPRTDLQHVLKAIQSCMYNMYNI
jgi:uncharacterized protein YxjI